MKNSNPFSSLDEDSIRILRKRLLLYATNIIKKYGNSLNFDAEDLVHEAFNSLLHGNRKINSHKHPDLYISIAGCIRSIASNTSKKNLENKLKRENDIDYKDTINFTPEEEAILTNEIKNFLLFVSKNRSDLLLMAKAMLLKGIDKPKDLAEHLSLDIKKVNSDKKRLKRYYEKISK